MKRLALAVLVACATAAGGPMNTAGPYTIANPPNPGNATRTFRGDFFEMLSPVIATHYSEVFWQATVMTIPAEIVALYNNSVMAVTGLEMDLVRQLPNGSFVSVPSWHQYNHHVSAWMYGRAATLVNFEEGAKGGFGHGRATPRFHVDDQVNWSDAPSVQVFSEANGNEHRLTYKFVLFFTFDSFFCF